VLDALDLRQHLLAASPRAAPPPGARAREGMKTLAKVTLICGSSSRGVNQHGEEAEQHAEQRQERRDLGREEARGDAARKASLALCLPLAASFSSTPARWVDRDPLADAQARQDAVGAVLVVAAEPDVAPA